MPTHSKPTRPPLLLTLLTLFLTLSPTLTSAKQPAAKQAPLGQVNINDLLDSSGALSPNAYASTHDPPPSSKSKSHSSSPSDSDSDAKEEEELNWTHTPLCTHSTSPSTLGTKYCTYTNNATFLNGLSLITTPKVADAAREFLSEHPVLHFFSEDEEAEKFISTPRPFAIKKLDGGKGYGVVATQKIKQYDTYMVDQASVVMDVRIEKSVSEEESLRLLRTGVDRLREPRLVRYLSAKHGHTGERGDHKHEKGSEEEEEEEEEGEEVDEEEEEEERKLKGEMDEHIMMTNSFGTEFAGEDFRGVFPLISRINHACNPNSFVMFSQSGFSIAIKAYRDIEPGEEITISYLYLGAPSAHRAKSLARWGFKCTCDLCSLPPDQLAASDKRRTRIQEGELEFQKLWKDGKYQAALRIGNEMVKLIKEEGLTPMLTDEYVMLARIHYLLEEREVAEEYKDMAVEILGNLGFLGGSKDEEWSLERIFEAFGNRGFTN